MSPISLGVFGGGIASKNAYPLEWIGRSATRPPGASALVVQFYASYADITGATISMGGSEGTLICSVDQPSGNVTRDIGIWWVDNPLSNELDPGSTSWNRFVLWVRNGIPGESRVAYSNNPAGGNPTGNAPPHTPTILPGGLVFSFYGARNATPPTPGHDYIDAGFIPGGLADSGSSTWTVGYDLPIWTIARYYAMATLAINPRGV